MKQALRKLVSSLLLVTLVLGGAPLQAQPVQAAPTELFFTEYIEGSSNNKALEIYNGTGAAIDLAANSYNVQMYFNGNASAGLTINLTGVVADGDVFILAHASASAAILSIADQTNGAGWFNGDDAVVLRKDATIIDVIGQIGVDPGSQWGIDLTSTADNTLRRKPTIEAGDANGSDAFDPSLEWEGYAIDTFDGLGAPYLIVVDPAPGIIATMPVNNQLDVALDANLQVTFSEAVDVTGEWFSIDCSLSGVRGVADTTLSGGPTSFTIDPAADFLLGDGCMVTVFAAGVSDQDINDPPDTMLSDAFFAFTTSSSVCELPYTPIYAIQGSGSSAAITGIVSTEGIVVGDFETTGINGFYLQDTSGDGAAETSDGIFVFTGGVDTVSAGQLVHVTGYARERFEQTTLNGSNSNTSAVSPANITACDVGSVAPVDVLMPFDSGTYLERFEGMAVRFPQQLQIAEYFNYDRYGEMVLAMPLDGEPRPFTGTALDEPGADALARAAANALRRVTLDDGSGFQNPSFNRHPNGAEFTLTNTFRGGDIVQNAVGVLGYDFSLYRIQPTGPANFTPANPRPLAPEMVAGSLKVASLNTLNYFVTLDYPSGDPLDNTCGPLNDMECRGADADQPDEFARQRAKLLATLIGLDGDIVGLNELENTTGAEPLLDIVNGLNDSLGAGAYAYIDTGAIGTDAIKVGFIYQPARVTPVGGYQILDSSVDARFLDDYNRPVLAQTFEVNASGERFTVAVNHLKSKGSDCNLIGDPDLGDGQGNCNLTRTAAAAALVDWLAADPTGSGDPDFMIIGDLNSYAREDPIDTILAGPDDTLGTADDYTNLVQAYQGDYAYSYVFDGQFGYLDYALASASLAPQIAGLSEWHINADEPDLLDYDTSFKSATQDALYEPLAYRSSDHDPVLVFRIFDFEGFFPPVDNPPVVNVANAGRAVPLKFSLNGDQGLDIFAPGSPTSQRVACGSGNPTDGIEETASAGNSMLFYKVETDVYTYVWKTEKSWKNTCREFTMVLTDGTVHTALFRFQ